MNSPRPPDADGGRTERYLATPLSELWQQLGWQRKELTPQERREVLSQLFFDGHRRLPYLYRFFTLLGLSVTIAAFGLQSDSTAVVIGAMLVAPLMTPIQAAAASLVMGWEKRQLQSLILVGLAIVWSIVLSYGFGLLMPDRVTLPGEVLSRTAPTLLDLGIALTAGAAGAYTLVRRESSALPGVAVAVALVPPLTVVGLTLENGDIRLSLGALLLFSTNLFAIILAASLVLLITGFTPRALVEQKGSLIRRGMLISVVTVLLVSIPLGIHSERVITGARDRHLVEKSVDTWLEGREDFDVMTIDIDGDDVRIDIVGPEEPTDTEMLDRLITDELGEDATLEVRWIQRNSIHLP
ncbi:MAG: DUF389 domain-containing protein [Thermomicrobiales bacterium]